jgi:hypothetical protein
MLSGPKQGSRLLRDLCEHGAHRFRRSAAASGRARHRAPSGRPDEASDHPRFN